MIKADGIDAHERQSVHGGARGVRVVMAATVVMAMGFGGLALVTVFMGPMEAELGWSRSDTSLGYAISTAGMAIGGLVWGRLSDRMDIRILVSIGAVGTVGSLVTMAVLTSLPAFYMAHLAYGGLGFSVLYALLLSTSGDWFPEQRGLMTGIVTAGGAFGQGVLPFVASRLIDALGWRWAFVATGVTVLAALALTLPLLTWPHGTKALAASSAGVATADRDETFTVAVLGLAAFLCCLCMGVPLVHMARFIGSACGSSSVGVNSLLTAMVAGAVGRVVCGSIADRIGPLTAYAGASAIQTACVMAFPALEHGLSFMVLSAVFGVGFAGNMTCLALCVRQAVPASRFGGAIGIAMMAAWVGMAAGGYAGGVLFDVSQSYTLSFLLAGAAGVVNLAVLGALAAMKRSNHRSGNVYGHA